jgi:poly-gamma-glutamate synthesis protein (capsule biosynthesis protein)
VTGNTFWGRYMEQWSTASSRGRAYPFSRLEELHRDRYDAWISGLECPTVPGVHRSIAEQERLLSFNCDPSFLGEASRWFSVFSLANNHTDNQGPAGVDTTREELRRAGIGYFGDPDPANLSRVCSVVGLQARVARSDGRTTTGHLPVGLCGFHGVFEIPPPAAIRVLGRLSRRVPVLALPHSGLEYVARETGIKVALYRSMIDAGADAVLGDHAHWVQNSEAYKGRPIVYSMGNFIFDQQDDAEVTRAAAIKIRLTVADQPHLEDWLALGERCAQTTDCTSLVEAADLPELQVQFAFGVVGVSTAGRITHAASPAVTAGILQRLDWTRTLAGLRPPYRAW